MEAFKTIADKAQPTLYVIFRVIIGAIFMLHGMSKLGWLGGTTATGLMLVVGIAEFLIGLGVLTGTFTRLSAIGGIIITATAYFWKHVPGTTEAGEMILRWNPLVNRGEAALLFVAIFLVIFAMGAGKLSLEKLLFRKKKEFF